jgi:VWFA-related protein
MRAQGCIWRRVYGLAASPGAFATLILGACVLSPPRAAWAAGQKPDQPEISSHETAPAFQLHVQRNVVVVRVVVRDPKGHALGNFGRDDFTLFDNGRPQIISGFSVEQVSAVPAAVPAPAKKLEAPSAPATPAAPPATSAPQRFVALYFDDLHMGIQDVGRSRAAADRYLATALGPQDRVALFTSSGIDELEFTDDRAKLHEALSRLRPRSKTLPTANTCPEIGEYQAYLITQLHHGDAIDIAMAEASNCGASAGSESPSPLVPQEPAALRVAELEARRIWALADLQCISSLDMLDQVVRRLAAIPGQRNLVLVSSGFLAATHQPEVEQIIDRALRSSVVINALDAQGLYTHTAHAGNPTPWILTPGRPDLETKKFLMENGGLKVVREVLGTLAAGTGGTFFTNSNDLDEGFRTVGALPEAYYVLTFSPQDLKPDGAFHRLKVQVNSREPLTVQARHGYFAPGPQSATGEKPSQVATEIETAVFSPEESHQLPAEVRTEYAKVNEQEATLTVFVHLDVRALRFRREQGRNVNTLTFATALFDRDGQCVTGNERVLEFRLKDETLENLVQSGFTVGTKLTVRPGTYRLREVVRDAEAGQISALNRPVEIVF